ncbi:hypothetical protein FOZ63_029589 [Perkinsus olseni]|uniref:Acyl-CoA dehydrogenase n=3 Tax=Perkinsus olseni TaxID=32597 RepID=A0A7J6N8U0_PEROL|nr:hypothetical protein FOZ63_029589 [Perkinsus olseni]
MSMIQQAKRMGVNTEVFGDASPFGDPNWYQSYNSPYYNDSHKRLRASMRQLVEEKLMPHVHEWDENLEIPREVHRMLGQTGIYVLAMGHPYPTQYQSPPDILKGVQLDTFHELVLCDELARAGSGGLAWGVVGGLTIGLPPVLRFGPKAMRDRVVPECLSGEKIICLAITEPTAGSDVANIRCSAKKSSCGKFYIVNGEKKWITNGIWADYFTVAVRTGGPGMDGISLLLIEKTMPGVTTRRMKCSGVWSSGTTFISFDDVKVPVENLIGKENKGFKCIMHNFNHERLALCTLTNRFARVCYEEALKHANKRKTFGKTLVQHPVIRFKLGEMARQIEATHSWMEQVAYQVGTMHPLEANMKLGGVTALLKVQCTKVFEYCARESAQIFGGLSYSRGGVGEKVERLNREVRAMAVPGGSEEIMLDLGVKQMSKLAEMAKTLVEQAEQENAGNKKQMAMARAMGVNTDVFGDANAFGDPYWYQASNSPFYNESHRKLREYVRGLFEKEIMPHVFEWDENLEIPREVHRKMGSLGLTSLAMGHPYPVEYGNIPDFLKGVKIDVFHELIVSDELCRCGSGGVAWGLVGGLTIGLPPVLRFGPKAMRDRVVPECLSGEKIICLAITEPTAGSDVANIRCSAKKSSCGKYYIVNGEKKWITNGIWADYFTVAVRTGGPGMDGISLLLIEKTMPGVTTRRMKCSGVWSSGTTFISFDDVKVPVENLIGKENKGFKCIMHNFNHERFALCAQTNRFARVCYEEALKHAHRRKTFGKPLIQHQVIRWKLAEMSRLVEATHAWLENVAYQLSTMHPLEANMKLGGVTALLKVQCTKVFEYCARESAQIFGGLSYSRGGVGEKVERLNREVRAMAVPGGSEEIMLDLGVRQMRKLAEMAKTLVSEAHQGNEASSRL